MKLTVGYIPYLNMAPFHQGFGPAPLRRNELDIEFRTHSPRMLGMEAEAGRVDAGALSLVDYFRLSHEFESLGSFGIGVKRSAKSVLVFSKKPFAEISGVCAVTDETATSVRLLQVLLEKRYGNHSVSYGRIASSLLFDGDAPALLLIGDEALRAGKQGIKGFPVVTDLGEEWFSWQGTPFVFAHWAVRATVPEYAKKLLKECLEKSLQSMTLDNDDYLSGFHYRLNASHRQSMEKFKVLVGIPCLTP